MRRRPTASSTRSSRAGSSTPSPPDRRFGAGRGFASGGSGPYRQGTQGAQATDVARPGASLPDRVGGGRDGRGGPGPPPGAPGGEPRGGSPPGAGPETAAPAEP